MVFSLSFHSPCIPFQYLFIPLSFSFPGFLLCVYPFLTFTFQPNLFYFLPHFYTSWRVGGPHYGCLLFFFLSFTIVTCQIVRNDPSEILGIGHGFYAGQHDIRLWRLWSQLTVLVGCFTSVMSCFGIFIDKLNWNGTALILTMFFLGNLQKSSVRYCQKSLMILEICLNSKIVAKLIQRAPWLKWTVSSASP